MKAVRIKALKYLAGFSVPAAVAISFYLGGWYSFIAAGYVFVILPFLELLAPEVAGNMTEAEEEVARQDSWYDYLLYLMVPIQFGLLFWFLILLSQTDIAPYEIIGFITAMGVSCATLGINVAHELGHRHKAHEKVMAKLLLLTSLYMHFIIEHNRGHHRRVSTPEDPSSARKGEILYAFWFRSVTQAYLSAWKLERGMLQKKGKPFISLHNEMIRFTIFQIAFVIGILLLFGPVATLGFIAAAVMGFLLLETVNYIEHYGLSRKELSPGRYEKTRPVHSWNSDHALGRLMLFELTRHSDHHAYSGRKYQTLRHYDESPQMPAGYPAMVVLSTIPPIWFKVMHRHMEKSGLS